MLMLTQYSNTATINKINLNIKISVFHYLFIIYIFKKLFSFFFLFYQYHLVLLLGHSRGGNVYITVVKTKHSR